MAKRVKAQEPTETIKAMKGFDKNLACRGFQFEVGKTYEQAGTIDCCSNGFHAITGSPFDIWDYYPVVADDGSLSRYAEVTLAGATDRQSDGEDSKIAAAKITVDVEISLPDFIRRAVAWVVDTTKGKGDNPSGHSAQIGSSGDSAQIAVEGNNSVVASAGIAATVSGPEGTWVSLAEFDRAGKCIGFATGCIGKDGLLPGVSYRAPGGKLAAA